MGKFTGKVVIVTGASSGIGRSTAENFAKEGAKVAIVGRTTEQLEVTKELMIKTGAKTEDILIITADVTKEEDTIRIVADTIKKFGQLDVLVNNAGGATLPGYTDSHFMQPLDVFDYVMNLNCRSVLALCQQAIPHLKKTKGNIINVSSVAATRARAVFTYYATAKAALDHLGRCLAQELAADGVRLNTVSPGPVRTSFHLAHGMSEEARDKMEEHYVKQNVPMKRSGQPEEIATVIAFVANNAEASFMTGQLLVVDGGSTIGNPPLVAPGKEGGHK